MKTQSLINLVHFFEHVTATFICILKLLVCYLKYDLKNEQQINI